MRLCMGCMTELSDDQKVCPYCGYRKDTPPEEAYFLFPETRLADRYIVGKVLGYGGFGVTYIGWDVMLKRRVAIKEYFPSDYATRGMGAKQITVYSGEASEQFQAGLKSFVSEAKRLAQFHQTQGIVHIYDCFQENGTGYIVMEYLVGNTVKEILEKQEKYPYDEAEKIILNVLDILSEVHRAGIIHRDVAPDNIFITEDGIVKLLDFGAARYVASAKSKSFSVILKLGYAPEEQYRTHGEQGPWTDVYGAGATFYRMITGVRPEDSIDRMIEDHLKKPSELGIKIETWKENALMTSLAVRREQRFQSADAFRNALLRPEAETNNHGVHAEENRKKKWVYGLIGTAVLAGTACLACVWLWQDGRLQDHFSVSKSSKQAGNFQDLDNDAPSSLRSLSVDKEESEVNGQNAENESDSEEMTERETIMKSESESELGSETELESETEPESETELESETETESETELESETEQESETESESEREQESETERKSESELLGSNSKLGSETESESGSELWNERESESESEQGSKTESESERESESESESESETEQESETETEPTAVSNTNQWNLTIQTENGDNQLIIANKTDLEAQELRILESQEDMEDAIPMQNTGDGVNNIRYQAEEGKDYCLQLVSQGEQKILNFYNVRLADSRMVLLYEKNGYTYISYRTKYDSQYKDLEGYRVKTYGAPTVRYSLTSLNIRALPDTEQGEILYTAALGDELQICGEAKGLESGETTDWYLIATDEGYGYISANAGYTTDDKATADAEKAAQEAAAQAAAEAAARAAQEAAARAAQSAPSGGSTPQQPAAPSGGRTDGVIWDDGGVVWEN